MLKICENLMIGTNFEQLSRAQIMLKFKNFCAHHKANDETVMLSTENVQNSLLGPNLWTFEKKFPKKCERKYSLIHFYTSYVTDEEIIRN